MALYCTSVLWWLKLNKVHAVGDVRVYCRRCKAERLFTR